MEPERCRQRPRRDVMRPAERRQKVVQRVVVRHVDRLKSQTPLEAVPAKQIVVAHRHIKQIPRRDARRIMVVILRAWLGNTEQRRPILRCRAEPTGTDRHRWSRMHAATEKASLELLVGRYPGNVHDRTGPQGTVVTVTARAWHRPCHQAAVVSPGKSEPRLVFPRLILQMRRLIELLVV